MKMCNAEIIKKIKHLEQKKLQILQDEKQTCTTTYITESDKISVTYNFTETRQVVEQIDNEVRHLKCLLSVVNSTVRIDGFDMTIGESLVYLAQLNSKRGVLEKMAGKQEKCRNSTYNGEVEYVELNYSLSDCRQQLENIQNEIQRLQMEIDRTNLSNMVEV